MLSDSRKKAPANSQGHQSREQLIERPWLQFICCTPVSSREVVVYFGVIEVIKTKVLKGKVQELERTRWVLKKKKKKLSNSSSNRIRN